MLDQNDIKQIGTLLQGTEGKLKEFVKENNKELTQTIVLQVGEFITDNVLTAIDDVEKRLSEKINTLPTRDYLDRVATDVKGTLVAQLRTEDQKVNLLITFLKEKNVLNDQQWKALKELQVFPAIDIA